MNTSAVSHQPSTPHRPSTTRRTSIPHAPLRPLRFPSRFTLPPVLDDDWDEQATSHLQAHTPLGWRGDYPDVEKVLNSYFQ